MLGPRSEAVALAPAPAAPAPVLAGTRRERPSEYKDVDKLINHERIHLIQQIELGVILFYPLYIYYNVTRGYWNNPFELEAYDNEDNLLYRSNRDMYSWTKYI